MNSSVSSNQWRVICGSVRGAAHVRAGKPNQDAIQTASQSPGKVAVVAVADGHGSRKSFRSERGAKLAAEVAVEQLRSYAGPEWLDALCLRELLRALRRDAEVELPQRIMREWQRQVDEDIAREPFTQAELDALPEAEQRSVSADPRLAYGTTLVAAVLLPQCAVYLQLGDGDILVIGTAGEDPTRPLPPDERSFANETASLSSAGAGASSRRPGGSAGPWADFRVRVVPMAADLPALVLLTTDGYVNAFVNDAGFRKAATDLLSLGEKEGWAYVERQLPDWLEEASRQGSGDDVTVAVIAREELAESRNDPKPLVRPIGAADTSLSHEKDIGGQDAPPTTEEASN